MSEHDELIERIARIEERLARIEERLARIEGRFEQHTKWNIAFHSATIALLIFILGLIFYILRLLYSLVP